jgi:uncharacterized protein involved in outer membrane biogenesis
MKKLLLAVLLVMVVGSIALFFWARSVLAQDAVRAALAAELSEALGQPVTIGSISAAVYPRVTVKLGEVVIGEPAGVQIATLDVGTDFRALLSRRIEHATARAEGARIQLPLIPMGRAPGATPARGPSDAGASPVELVSIDEIVVEDVELASGGRVLRGDIEIVPEAGGALNLRRVSLAADDASIEAKGRITDLNGPVGELTIEAGELNVDRLLAFFNDFAGQATTSSTGVEQSSARAAEPDLHVGITAARAYMAGLTLDALSARARVTDTGVMLQPMTFGVLGGKYDGSVGIRSVVAGGPPAFTFTANLGGVDVAEVIRFAGAATDPITGRLSGQLEVVGTGADAAAALRSLRGRARVNIVDGIVRNLGLVRAVVIATSMRGAASTAAGAGVAATTEANRSRDEPFKMLRATVAIAGGRLTTNDLHLEGTDVSLDAAGSIPLDGRALDLAGRVQLSDELTAQAGTDLVRYTREDGRVTLPVTVTGPPAALAVRIDVGDAMKRAIRNRVEDEAKKAIMKGLGGLFKKPPR